MLLGTAGYLKWRGKVLLIERKGGEKDIHNGLFIPPGGHIESGERSLDCILREFREETGLKLKAPKLRIIATFDNKSRILGNDKPQEDWRVDFYESFGFTGTLKPDPEKPWNIPTWINESNLPKIKMYEGDRKLYELLSKPGVFEAVFRYSQRKLISFEETRVF